MCLPRWLPLFIGGSLVLLSPNAFGQRSISGYLMNENNEPIPFVHIFIRELATGTTTDEKGYYFLTIDPGNYNFTISAVGYQSQTVPVIIGDKPVIKNFFLKSSSTELNEIIVKASRRDPAYEIIQNVIDTKEKYISQVKSARTKVYLRAMETVEQKERKRPERQDESIELSTQGPPTDPLEEARKKEQQKLGKVNFVEMQLTLNYLHPDKYKEERTGFKLYGSRDGLFIPLFSEADFNFYHNLVDMKGISEIPVISPVSRLAIISYKYKLEEVLKEDEKVVYKIRVTPRKTGDATCRGFLFINDSTWNINRLELTLQKGGLKFYDVFTIRQSYENVNDDVWIPVRQEFDYQTKLSSKLFKGNTVLVFSDYEKDYSFPPKFFGNEVSVITKEAYERDSAYWNNTRPEPLTPEQQKVVAYRDSVEAAHNTKEYLDSILTQYNKVTVGEVLLHGFGFRNDTKKSNLFLPSLLNLVGFEVIGGFRVSPYGGYARMFDNGRRLWTSANVSMGFKNKDLQGNLNFWTRYNPYRLGDASVRVGRSFAQINTFDAYLNQLRISNFILHDYVQGFHRIELFNGFFISTDIGFHDRRSLDDYDRTSIINEVIDEVDPLVFDDYQALITETRLSYTPKQRFMTEPNQKVILGSNYPTFTVTHQKGWNELLTSDVDFDYLGLEISQNLILGTLGNSRYSLMAGKFVNSRNLPFVDIKRFRESDPILYSDPLHSFQLLDTSLTATNIFLEAHYIHHFNGALINNIPLVKKLRIGTVAGAGAMWIKESNYRHEEIFAGIERIFKLGKRRRLRVGAYGVISQSNYSPPQTDFKISFDVIDTWKRDWSY